MARFNGWRLTRAGLVFIIVAIVLAVIAFGAIRFVQQRGEQVRQEEAAQVALQNLEEQSETGVIAEETPATDGEEAVAPGGSTNGQTSQPAQPGQTGNSNPGGAANGSSIPQTGVAELPATGIQSFLPMVFLAVAAYAVAHYVQNRRTQSQN